MVPEGLLEGAALSASEPVDEGKPEAEAEAAPSAEVAAEGSTGFNWADASEAAPELSAVFGTGGAAASAPAEAEEEDLDILEFDALSLLDKPKAEEEVTAEQLFEALEADAVPVAEPADQPEASGLVETEAENNLEIDNPDNQLPKEEIDFSNDTAQEISAELADSVAEPIVGSSPSVAEPDPNSIEAPVYVTYPADAVAEEDEVPPPLTSPFLEQEGAATGASTTGHVRVGHSPSGPSRPPRVRGTKGGKKAQTKRLIKRWQHDFDELADFLWDETGFWLHYIQHEDAPAELIWTVRVFRVLYNHCTPNQILIHFANVFAPYRNWTFVHGYRNGQLRHAADLVATTVLPDQEHINLQAFGDSDPPRSVWDDYVSYRGPQPKGGGRGSVFVQNTEAPSASEQAANLGIDPGVDRGASSSEETHTPSPREAPKPKARPKERPVHKPKEPDHPPPWVPSLRPVEHQANPKVSHSVASVPPPSGTGRAAPERPKQAGQKQPSEPKTSGEASVPEPAKSKPSEPKVAKSPKDKDNPLKRLGPPPSYPAPPVPAHRDFHQTLGPPPQQPPKAASATGDRATAIPPPPSQPPPSAVDLDRQERGRPRERAVERPDKTAATSAPPKPLSRSRTRVPAVLTPRADGSFADPDTEVLRRARGGNLGTPSLSSRPIALRPTDNNYPPVVINSEGTWVRISKPPGATGREPTTVPVAIPGAAHHP